MLPLVLSHIYVEKLSYGTHLPVREAEVELVPERDPSHDGGIPVVRHDHPARAECRSIGLALPDPVYGAIVGVDGHHEQLSSFRGCT